MVSALLRLLCRDVKASNILLTRDGEAKVADVGLATMRDGFSSAHATTGTFLYAAPEILMGRPSTAKVPLSPKPLIRHRTPIPCGAHPRANPASCTLDETYAH